ncbi:hypothetical protein C8R42DRAFT_572615 [Lentinula raphanica]|nr:hypothetical protein C8R42DRAFT_572735 [Lentinula raphanica]KAJ3727658.1 hypothetical protein C8R42DRAFT_572615 [Lentinula raphanica]
MKAEIFTAEELDNIKNAAEAGTRKIRDSDIYSRDIAMLVEGGKKLYSSVMNAVAAKIQADAEALGESPTFCVFSSWLGPLVHGKAENGITGTFDMHIQQAVSSSF